MDSDLRQSMFRYYDERAPEYEEAYLLGTGTASIRDPGVFQAEALLLEHVVERFGHGRIRTLPLSDSSELPMRLRGAAALAGRIKASIAVTGGVHTGLDVIKATMAGAHGTQMVSALLRHGPDHLRAVRREVETWMREHEWESLSEMRGNMSLQRIPDPAAYERANFRMALR
jgi:hypothetical protein